jgi:hypothetical protein
MSLGIEVELMRCDVGFGKVYGRGARPPKTPGMMWSTEVADRGDLEALIETSQAMSKGQGVRGARIWRRCLSRRSNAFVECAYPSGRE